MKFPDPEQTGEDGLLAMGGDLTPETLHEAYSLGIFPWPQEGFPLLWFSPPERGVLFFNRFKIPKSTRKAIKEDRFQVTWNSHFDKVIESCARVPRNHESGTWILPEMVEVYKELHRRGFALSVEAWQNSELVGGLYGVFIDGVFSGESMFFYKSEASKVCLVYLVEEMKKRGLQWIDIQMVTSLLAQFGGEYIPRKKFLTMLKESHANR